MEDFWKIYKLHFKTFIFDLEKYQPGTAEHYEINLDGTIKTYDVPYGSRKQLDIQKKKVSEEKVKAFLEEASELIKSAAVPLEMIDDCAREWTISFGNHVMKMDGDLETKDGRNLEALFWNFIESL